MWQRSLPSSLSAPVAQAQTGMTRDTGAPVGDNQDSKTAGPDGPVLLEDNNLIEKLARFDRERIPERVVHARGTGAEGVFVASQDLSQFTRASLVRHPRQGDAGLCALLDRDELSRLAGGCARPARFRGEILHRPGQLGYCRHQRAGLLHSRCDQVSRLRPRQQAIARDERTGPQSGVRLLLARA